MDRYTRYTYIHPYQGIYPRSSPIITPTIFLLLDWRVSLGGRRLDIIVLLHGAGTDTAIVAGL